MPVDLSTDSTHHRIHVENDKQKSSLLYFLSCVPESQIYIVKTPNGGRVEWRPRAASVYSSACGLNWELIEQLNSAHSNLLKYNRESLAKSMTRKYEPRKASLESHPSGTEDRAVKGEDPVKPLNWLLKLIDEIYASRLKLFSQEIENSGKPYYYNLFEYTDWAVQLTEHPDTSFEDFSNYMFHFLTKRVGLDSLVKKMGNELLSSIKHYRGSILEVEIFGLFLSSEKQKVLDQIFFMSCWCACMEHSQCISEVVNNRTCWRRYLSVSVLPKLIYRLLKFNDQTLYDRVKVQYNQWLLFADASIKVVEKTRTSTPRKRGVSPSRPRESEQLMLMSNFVVFLLLNFKAWRREQESSSEKVSFRKSSLESHQRTQEKLSPTSSFNEDLHNASVESRISLQRESAETESAFSNPQSHEFFIQLQRQHEGKLKELITSYPLSPVAENHQRGEEEFKSVSFLNEFMDKSPKKTNPFMNNSRNELEDVDDVEPPSFSGIKNVMNSFHRVSLVTPHNGTGPEEEEEVSEFLDKLGADDPLGKYRAADAHELSDISMKSDQENPRLRLAAIQDAYRIANEGTISHQKVVVSPTSLINNSTILDHDQGKAEPSARHKSSGSFPSADSSWSDERSPGRVKEAQLQSRSPLKADSYMNVAQAGLGAEERLDHDTDYEIMNSDAESDDVFWCGDDNDSSEMHTIGSYASNSRDIEKEILQLERQLFAAGEKLKTFQKK